MAVGLSAIEKADAVPVSPSPWPSAVVAGTPAPNPSLSVSMAMGRIAGTMAKRGSAGTIVIATATARAKHHIQKKWRYAMMC